MNFNLFYEINKRDLLQDDIWLTKHIQKGRDSFNIIDDMSNDMLMFKRKL